MSENNSTNQDLRSILIEAREEKRILKNIISNTEELDAAVTLADKLNKDILVSLETEQDFKYTSQLMEDRKKLGQMIVDYGDKYVGIA